MDKIKQGMRRRLTRYGDDEFALFLRKSPIKGLGYGDAALEKPVIGIINTASDTNSCHGNVDELMQGAKSGVLATGALPLAFPTISLRESFAYPKSMYLRNLMAMDTEEIMKALPLDGCILVGGCDKTVLAQIMGALSARLPFVQLVSGPMLTGSFFGERVGACTDCRRLGAQYRVGVLIDTAINEASKQLVPTIGTCGVMGTASTMALITETLGLMLDGGACAPAVSVDRRRIAEATGHLAVDMAAREFSPDGRMSGTASGTIILHVAPEAAIGGLLALVQSGDRICLDAARRRLELVVSDDELAHRQNALQLPVTATNRGYGKLFYDHVLQAPGGVDFDFLQGVDAADA